MEGVSAFSEKSRNIIGWPEWVAMEGRQFSFVEKQFTRKYSKLKPLGRKTPVSCIQMTTKKVETEIAATLPQSFGIVINGWSDMNTSTNFLAIFACYGNSKDRGTSATPLLAFSPLLNEDNYSAAEHVAFIDFTFRVFGKNTSNLAFLVRDNENLNKAIVPTLDIPLIGCYSQ